MTKQSIEVMSMTFQASGAVGRGRAVGFDGAQASVAGQAVLGVSRASFAAGEYGDARVIGTAVCEAGGIVQKGSKVSTDGTGRTIATVSAGANAETFGYALEAAVAGDLFEVLLRH